MHMQGIGTQLLKSYLESKPVEQQHVQLICKEPMVEWYKKAGFALRGPSQVVHGQEQWILMHKFPKRYHFSDKEYPEHNW